MRIADFDYELPEEAIAQRPTDRRDASRLLVLRGVRDGTGDGAVAREHRRFAELHELLEPGDLLVLNDARVLPARLYVRRPTGGRVELLFLGPCEGVAAVDGAWRALARPAKRVRPGDTLTVEAPPGHPAPALEVIAEGEAGERTLTPADPAGGAMVDLLEEFGRMPLPPYIERAADEAAPATEQLDRERYQTVYAATPGAVAAPTAGLHFTEALLGRLRERGVEIETVTLHVGAGTFRPVTADRVEDHVMDTEVYRILPEVAERIGEARAGGRRVIAVGTTSVRTLEHAWDSTQGRPRAGEGRADLFITPGYRFRAVDGMITNFHLPRSTPILLVAALIGREPLLSAYREAVERGYRFYSYGDAMLVLPATLPT